MKGTNILRKNLNSLESNLEGQKFEDMAKIFIESLYESNLKENSHFIKDKKNMNKNLKKFMNTCRKWVREYASNIKRDYTKNPQKDLLDIENEESNIYLYIVESLNYFYIKHCNSNIELFKEYINNNNKTYVNIENKEYTFNQFMYMSVERKIKEENKLLEKCLEKGNMDLNGVYSKVELDSTIETEEGKEKEIDLYNMGLFRLLHDEDRRSDEQILQDNIREMKRIQDKLSTVLTKLQVEFITTEVYGCYYDLNINDFVIKEYTKQQRNQFLNQISKRLDRDIKPFFIKKHNKKYVEEITQYRRKNRNKLKATPRKVEDYIDKHSSFEVSNIKING